MQQTAAIQNPFAYSGLKDEQRIAILTAEDQRLVGVWAELFDKHRKSNGKGKQLEQQGKQLVRLDIEADCRYLERDLGAVFSAMPAQLMALNVRAALDDNQLCMVWKKLPSKLVHLELCGKLLPANSLYGLKFPETLKSLSVPNFEQGCTEDLHAILYAKSLKSLQHLKLTGWSSLEGYALENMLETFPELVELDLSGWLKASDTDLVAVSYLVPQGLRRLAFKDCGELSDDGLADMRLAFKQPVEIDFRGCPKMTDGQLQMVADCLPQESTLLHDEVRDEVKVVPNQQQTEEDSCILF